MSAALFAELASVCSNRHDTDRVRLVLEREKLSPVAILAVLQQAIAADHAALVEVVLRIPGAVCDVNAPVLKDGKTLLHLAAAQRNLFIVRLLVDAGAKLTAADKKGLRVADTITWTDVVYPAVACPLQSAIFKLELRNEALEDDTRDINDVVGKTTYAADMVELENENALDELEAARRYKQSLLDQIGHAKRSVEETNADIIDQGPRSQLVAEEIERVRATTATMVAQVQGTRSETARLRKQSERLRRVYADQLAQLAVTGKQCAVKCEAVQTVDRFAAEELVQQRFLRALGVMCQRVDAVRRLAMGGIQSRVLDVLVRDAQNAIIVSDCVRIIVQVMEIKQKHPCDSMLATYIKPWPVEVVVDSIEHALAHQTTSEEKMLVLNAFSSFLCYLCEAPNPTNKSNDELQGVVRGAAQRLLNGASLTEIENPGTIQSIIHRLAA